MKMTKVLLPLLLSISAQSAMIKYEVDQSTINVPRINTGLFSIQTGLTEPTERTLSAYGKRSYIDELKREGKVIEDSCEKVSSGNLLALSGARYRCTLTEYAAKLAEFKKADADLKKSKLELELTGFTKSYGKIFGETTFQSKVAGLDSQKYLVQFDIQKCLDQYGAWWNKFADLNQGETKIEQHIQALFNETLQAYVRCDLRLTTITNKSGGQSGRTFQPADIRNETFLVIEDGESSAHVQSRSYYGNGEPVRYNELSKMPQGDNYSEDRLNVAIEDYGNFMKFEYGLILSEISMNELSTAESQLKVQRFLSENRGQIVEMLNEIDASMEPAPFFKKVSAGFYISSVYGHISKIEESLQTVLTLDHIIRARR